MKLRLIAITFTSLAVLGCPAGAFAQSTAASAESVFITASVGVGASLVLTAPLILSVQAVETSARNSNNMRIRATDHEGRPQLVEIPRSTALQLDIHPGDQLTTTPKEGGAMLEKEGKPVAFLMAPANANLTHSHELAQ
jgi:hypothetical protein